MADDDNDNPIIVARLKAAPLSTVDEEESDEEPIILSVNEREGPSTSSLSLQRLRYAEVIAEIPYSDWNKSMQSLGPNGRLDKSNNSVDKLNSSQPNMWCDESKINKPSDAVTRGTLKKVIDFADKIITKGKKVYKFQVAWDPMMKTTPLHPDITHHVLIAPYLSEFRTDMDIVRADLPDSPLLAAVEKMRNIGMNIVTGYWNNWNNPVAILLDVHSAPETCAKKYAIELRRDFAIHIPNEDVKCLKSVAFGYAVAELVIQFEVALGQGGLSKKSHIRFHDWTAAAGLIFKSRWRKSGMEKSLCLTRTRLGKLEPETDVEADNMARKMGVLHRLQLERVAALYANSVKLLARDVSLDLVRKQLSSQGSENHEKFKYLKVKCIEKAETKPVGELVKNYLIPSRHRAFSTISHQMASRFLQVES